MIVLDSEPGVTGSRMGRRSGAYLQYDTLVVWLCFSPVLPSQYTAMSRAYGFFEGLGVHAAGCHFSPGPSCLALAHGSAFLASWGVLCAVVVVFATGSVDAASVCSADPIAGALCPVAAPGASVNFGFASHLASAAEARCFILACLTTSFCCSSMLGGSSRVYRSHWCQRGLTLTAE
jgi:hypothetical protein